MKSPTILAFGDPIIYDGKEYIYLAKEENLIHLAEVLNRDQTNQLKRGRDDSVRRPGASENTLYSFVVLTTEELKERAAWLGHPARSAPEDLFFDQMPFSLIEGDKEAIKKEILDPNSGASIGLQKIVKGLK